MWCASLWRVNWGWGLRSSEGVLGREFDSAVLAPAVLGVVVSDGGRFAESDPLEEFDLLGQGVLGRLDRAGGGEAGGRRGVEGLGGRAPLGFSPAPASTVMSVSVRVALALVKSPKVATTAARAETLSSVS